MKVYVLLGVIGACSFLASARTIHQQGSNSAAEIAANLLYKLGKYAKDCADYNSDTNAFKECMGLGNTGNSGSNNGSQYTGMNPATTGNQPDFTTPAGGNQYIHSTGNLPPMSTPDNSNAGPPTSPPTPPNPSKREEDIAKRIYEILMERRKSYE